MGERTKSNGRVRTATNPSKLPVTALVTAPAPTAGEVHRRVDPLPVQVPAAPVETEAAADVVAWRGLISENLTEEEENLQRQ